MPDHGLNTQAFLGRLTNGAARDAIAPAFEGRARDQQLGIYTRHLPKQLFGGLLRVFRKVIVAAKESGDDFTIFCQCLLERAAGADGPGLKSGTDPAFFFAADLGEKLVQIMDDTNFFRHEDLLGWHLISAGLIARSLLRKGGPSESVIPAYF